MIPTRLPGHFFFRHALLLLLLSIGSELAQAQLLWQTVQGTRNVSEVINPVIRLRRGGYLMAGLRNEGDSWVVKVTETGDTAWTHTLRDSAHWRIHPAWVAENRSGQVLVVCKTWRHGTNHADGLLYCLSPAGQVVWQRPFDNPRTDGFSHVQLGNDGHFMALGDVNGHYTLLKLDSTGAERWRTRVPVLDSLEQGTAYFVLVQRTGYVVVSQMNSNVVRNGTYLIWVSETGQVLRRRFLFNYFVPLRVLSDADDNILLCHGGKLTKVDPQGNLLWSHQQFGGNQTSLITQRADGNYLNHGGYWLNNNYYPHLMLISPDGRLLRDTTLTWLNQPLGSRYFMSEMVLDSAGNPVMGGGLLTHTVGTTEFYDAFMVKLGGWPAVLGTTPSAERAGFTLAPNPATGQTRLRGTSPAPEAGVVRLLDALGRAISEHPLPAGRQHDLLLPLPDRPGLYTVWVKLPGRSFYQRLVVTQ